MAPPAAPLPFPPALDAPRQARASTIDLKGRLRRSKSAIPQPAVELPAPLPWSGQGTTLDVVLPTVEPVEALADAPVPRPRCGRGWPLVALALLVALGAGVVALDAHRAAPTAAAGARG